MTVFFHQAFNLQGQLHSAMLQPSVDMKTENVALPFLSMNMFKGTKKDHKLLTGTQSITKCNSHLPLNE